MLKKTLKLIFALGFFIFFSPSVLALEADYWQINNFVLKMDFQADSYKVKMNEYIDTNFDGAALDADGEVRRGILRYIPHYYATEDYKYSYRLQLNDFTVTDGNDLPRVFTAEIDDYLDSYFLRVGEADKYIRGRQIYNINYEVENGWRYFEDHDEFYWNVTGDDWAVPISASKTIMNFADLLTAQEWESLEAVCYTGYAGSLHQDCTVMKSNDSVRQLNIFVNRVLSTGEGLTVAVKLPAGTVPQFDPYDYYDLTDFTEDDLWQIESINIDLRPAENGKLAVKEDIQTYYNSENLRRSYQSRYGFDLNRPRFQLTNSGIFQKELLINNLSVKDGHGKDRKFQFYPDYYYDNYYLDLYDYDRELRADQDFIIEYDWEFLPDLVSDKWHFAWPVLDSDFMVDPQAWQVSLNLDELDWDLNELDLEKLDCYIRDDYYWDEDLIESCDIQVDIENKKVIFSSEDSLAYGTTVFIDFYISKEYWDGPAFWAIFKHLAKSNWPYLFPLGLFSFFFLLWWFFGKDYDLDRPLLVQYKAVSALSPAAVAELYYMKFKDDFITAEIIYLAVNKFIKIENKEKQYTLTLMKKEYQKDKILKTYHKLILDKLFSEGKQKTRTVSSLTYALGNYIKPIKKGILNTLENKGYLNHDPGERRKTYITWAIVLGLLNMFISAGAASDLIVNKVLLFSFIVQILLIIIAYQMPKLERPGAVALWEIQGLYHYLDTAEADRFKFGELTDLFEKLLPYAIALGMIDKWIEIMAKLYEKAPDWFESNNGFDAKVLSSFVRDFRPAFKTYTPSYSSGASSYRGSSSFSRPSTSSYRSSGFSSSSSRSSGSSGGFGGGGGSSW